MTSTVSCRSPKALEASFTVTKFTRRASTAQWASKMEGDNVKYIGYSTGKRNVEEMEAAVHNINIYVNSEHLYNKLNTNPHMISKAHSPTTQQTH